jgi:DNA-binding transcriptional ArsR family regulator
MSKKKNAEQEKTSKGRYAYEGLNRTIHEKARLGIMASLAAHPDGLLFTAVKELCALTDGNLNRHLQVLEEAKLVEVIKSIENRRPQTLCRLTRQGHEQLVAYLTVLEGVVADAAAARELNRATNRSPRPGWAAS